jgi:hypothetical protein
MEYTTANKAKASFDDVYNAPTPHGYLDTMTGLGYQIGDQAKPFFTRAIDHIRTANRDQGHSTVLDLGCSYGIGSALVLHDCTYDSLAEFFKKGEGKDVDVCIAETTEWLARRRIQADVKCVGMDQADKAVHFGEQTGLLARGIAKNLETGETLTSEEESCIRQCNILFSTGAIGYVGPKTLSPILKLLGKAEPENVGPVIVATLLRMFDPNPIVSCFQEHNFRFEKLSVHPLPQRNFESKDEQQKTIQLLKERGIETDGLEETGVLYADVYVGARDSDFADFFKAVPNADH